MNSINDTYAVDETEISNPFFSKAGATYYRLKAVCEKNRTR
ncbi:MAG: hypothetical protein ACFFBL_06160 [Promethearchaeota archaeon]